MRRASDGQAFIVPTGGRSRFSTHQVSTGWTAQDTLVATPDVTGDGDGDLGVRGADGVFRILAGDGRGGFGSPAHPTRLLAGRDRISAVGDLDEDGHHDLVARNPRTGRLEAYLGDGRGGFARHRLATGWNGYRLVTGAGDLDGDGHVDVVATTPEGDLVLRRGTGGGRFRAPTQLAGAAPRRIARELGGCLNRPPPVPRRRTRSPSGVVATTSTWARGTAGNEPVAVPAGGEPVPGEAAPPVAEVGLDRPSAGCGATRSWWPSSSRSPTAEIRSRPASRRCGWAGEPKPAVAGEDAGRRRRHRSRGRRRRRRCRDEGVPWAVHPVDTWWVENLLRPPVGTMNACPSLARRTTRSGLGVEARSVCRSRPAQPCWSAAARARISGSFA